MQSQRPSPLRGRPYCTTDTFLIVCFLVQRDNIGGDGEYEESQEGDQRLGGAPGRLGVHRVMEHPEAGPVREDI